MAEQRRYHDDEVREIFGRASDRQHADPPPHGDPAGLTLAEIQSIGLEVGLEPTVVARAAASLDVGAARLPQRTSLGMPIEVRRIVPLPRDLTDAEWAQLVAELRATFGARGRVASQPEFREWVNGNLHALVEPAEGGYRLRLGTVKGDASTLNFIGAAGLGAGAIAFGSAVLSAGISVDALFAPVMIGAAGTAAFLANMLRLPRWARQRERQMDYIADRVRTIVQPGGPPAVTDGEVRSGD
jgi:hypothetical protein